MIIPSDEETFKQCDELGEAAVEAGLKTECFVNSTAAYRWLIQHQRKAEQQRMQQEMRNTRRALYASWIMVAITFLGIWWQKQDAHEQREEAKALLEVQISSELENKFDSDGMRKARSLLASQLLKKNAITEFRVIDFFDSVAMYTHRHRIDREITYQNYSYWIKRYWPALKPHIEVFRKEQKDPAYYDDFESLYQDILEEDKKDGIVMPDEKEIQRFLQEESTLPK